MHILAKQRWLTAPAVFFFRLTQKIRHGTSYPILLWFHIEKIFVREDKLYFTIFRKINTLTNAQPLGIE
ncbi:MAG: hypothetical protein CSA20_05145 [Deltaproteobacteria bacterium]|nr:MAG: hypothetical protein CSA20_05145 [Deltaproteobacteria bacterium]